MPVRCARCEDLVENSQLATGDSGKVTVTVVPSPGRLSTLISPLWALTSSATIDKPIPVPSVASVREGPGQGRFRGVSGGANGGGSASYNLSKGPGRQVGLTL